MDGRLSYAKLFDMAGCNLALSDEDVRMLAARIRAYDGVGVALGPLAIVVSPRDRPIAAMYRLLAATARPIGIFVDPLKARRWLSRFL